MVHDDTNIGKLQAIQIIIMKSKGCIHSLDWTTGPEHWTGPTHFGDSCYGWFNWFLLATGSLQPITKW